MKITRIILYPPKMKQQIEKVNEEDIEIVTTSKLNPKTVFIEKSVNTVSDCNIKPFLRGRIHQIAFYKTILISFVYFIVSIIYGFRISILVYLLSQLILYGVSSTYHLRKWKSEYMRRLFQRLDHSSIFLLISGTQTGVFLTLLPENELAFPLLVTTWTISLLGILKVFVFSNIFEVLDVAIYITHGVCVIPFFRYLKGYANVVDWILFVSGGIFYIIGGLVFGFESPNPLPLTFGYHEIFHLLTVFGNTCFMITIIIKYLKLLGYI